MDAPRNSRVDGVNFKRWLIFGHDLAWIPVSIVAAYWIRFNLDTIPSAEWRLITIVVLSAVPIYGITFWIFGCYRGIWRYASIPDLVRLVKAVIFAAPITVLVCFLIARLQGMPRSVLLLYPFILICALTTARVAYRVIRDHGFRMYMGERKRALLVGAGRAGETLLRDLERSEQFEAVGFVDDDTAKRGHDIRGVRVYGTTNDIEALVEKLDVQIVLVTMPSAPRETMNSIVSQCARSNIKCVTLPALMELADGRIEVSRLRPVTVEDLLGRAAVKLDEQSIAQFLKGKRVLVTGGGGSIGSELCRQIAAHDPAILVIADNCEYNLYRIDQDLGGRLPSYVFSSALVDVRDKNAVEHLFAKVRPHVVFHAAAYKHVPMVEDNVIEGIRNNIFGTRLVADAALQSDAEKFVLISTDKTVNPTNVMGTTKRVAEIYCQALSRNHRTQFVTTRFGNVLASAGSVVPLFERQIAAGGPVTVTHPEITRYFMTIPEAASLILQAGAIGKGGEVFVLDMGEPIRIRDLAEKMIGLSGLRQGQDISIVYTGLRPGEKMHEELFYEKEELRGTAHPKLLLAESIVAELRDVQIGIEKLSKIAESYDVDQAMAMLKSLVPEFNPQPDTHNVSKPKAPNSLKLVRS